MITGKPLPFVTISRTSFLLAALACSSLAGVATDAQSECLPEEEARIAAGILEDEGTSVTLVPANCEVALSQVIVMGFRSEEAARLARQRLSLGGIDATLRERWGRPALEAGSFRELRDLSARLRQLEGLGFDNVVVSGAVAEMPGLRLVTNGEAEEPRTGNNRNTLTFGNTPRDTDDSMTFGDARDDEDESGAARSPYTLLPSIPRAQIELGQPTGSRQPIDGNHFLTLIGQINWLPDSNWSARATGRLDGQYQLNEPEVAELRPDYGETYLRYHNATGRITLGAQTVMWGRMDELPPTDRLSTRDLRRFALDDLAERRRASPMLRIESYPGEFHLDMIFLPVFREAELPEENSVWHPVDRQRGRILGLPDDPALAFLVREGSFDDRVQGNGGGGFRLSRDGRGLDYAVTVQRARHSAPYYELSESVRAALLETGDPEVALQAGDGDTFRVRHPRTWVVGGDASTEVGSVTWRAEAAWLSDVPATTDDLAFVTREGVEWAVGNEFFPGDRDFRVTLQLLGRHILDGGGLLEPRDAYFASGELELPFAMQEWRLGLRFSSRLDETDVYLNPEIAYTGWTGQELYLGYHHFTGSDGTIGEFYENRDVAVFGWRGQF